MNTQERRIRIQSRPLIYLACPYSHKDPSVREWRFHQANKTAAYLMECGYTPFSPISHSHSIAMDSNLPTSWSWWEKQDRDFMKCCHRLFVLCLPGWEESVGVNAEIRWAKKENVPIEYLEEKCLTLKPLPEAG